MTGKTATTAAEKATEDLRAATFIFTCIHLLFTLPK
jgi:hypothetical protein